MSLLTNEDEGHYFNCYNEYHSKKLIPSFISTQVCIFINKNTITILFDY